MAVVDVSSAPAAIEVKTILLPVNANSQIEVVEDRVYLYTDTFIYVFDVSDPANPVQSGQYDPPQDGHYFDVVGSQVYLTWQYCEGHVEEDGTLISGCGQHIELVDFTNPAQPLYLGKLRLGMPSALINETYFTAEAAYFVTDRTIFALDLNELVIP
jgi:hypothetical protein